MDVQGQVWRWHVDQLLFREERSRDNILADRITTIYRHSHLCFAQHWKFVTRVRCQNYLAFLQRYAGQHIFPSLVIDLADASTCIQLHLSWFPFRQHPPRFCMPSTDGITPYITYIFLFFLAAQLVGRFIMFHNCSSIYTNIWATRVTAMCNMPLFATFPALNELASTF